MSNISFIIMLLDIINRVVIIETMNGVEYIKSKTFGIIIKPLDIDRKSVGRIFSVRIIFMNPDDFF